MPITKQKGKLKVYRVWYSNRASAKVRAYSVQGARRQAWEGLGAFRYGWGKADFMRNATVQRID